MYIMLIFSAPSLNTNPASKSGLTIVPRRPLSRKPFDLANLRWWPFDCDGTRAPCSQRRAQSASYCRDGGSLALRYGLLGSASRRHRAGTPVFGPSLCNFSSRMRCFCSIRSLLNLLIWSVCILKHEAGVLFVRWESSYRRVPVQVCEEEEQEQELW